MNFWDQSDERNVIRLLALRLLLERSEQALSMSPRMAGDSAQAEGGQLSGWPPAPAPLPQCPRFENRQRTAATRELATLLNQESTLTATGAQARQIAELLEYLDRDEEALTWWKKAAARGDEDAQDYLDILGDEEKEKTGEFPCPDAQTGETPGGSLACSAQKAGSFLMGGGAFVAACLAATEPKISKDTERLLEEIEEFLTDPDRMTDGRRR
ncbi:hypothetical protein [Streptomyces olivaceiscleroticus]|uniref:Uncharacterized protein n=1 Tax=Streptomyces olivaceiscleroticus TaxID=68245 RepID=A0ABP3JFL6_9ACTN